MSLQKIRKTNFLCPKWKFIKIHLDVMNIVSQKTRIFSFFIIKSSLSCKNAQIFFISCFAKLRNFRSKNIDFVSCEISWNSKKISQKFSWNYEDENFLNHPISVWANLENIFSRLCPFNLHTQSIHDLWNCLKQLALRQCSFFGEIY